MFIVLGEKGFAFTLITEKDKEFAGALVRNLEDANQHVPKPLLDLALQVRFFIKILKHRKIIIKSSFTEQGLIKFFTPRNNG